MINNGFKEYIWTDNDFSRRIIWEAYMGFSDYFGEYIMYKHFKTLNPTIKAALVKYSHKFYYEVKHLIPTFLENNTKGQEKAGIKSDDWIEYEGIVLKTKYVDEEIIKIRNFLSTFMHFSGIKNPVLQKDVRTNYQKTREKFGLE